jgi:hypothetical protein
MHLALFIFQALSVYNIFLSLQVFLKQGPYGYYIQVGEDRKGASQKRASLSKVTNPLLWKLSVQRLITKISLNILFRSKMSTLSLSKMQLSYCSIPKFWYAFYKCYSLRSEIRVADLVQT